MDAPPIGLGPGGVPVLRGGPVLNLVRTFLLTLIAACAVGPGWADSIDEPWGGDWQGTFGSGSHRFQVAFQFWEDFGYYNNLDDGIYNELVSFGAGDGALDGVTPGGGTIHLDYFPRCPVMTGTFTQGAGKDGKQSLMGEGVSYPITLTRGSDRLRPRADKSYSYIPPQDLGDGLVPGDLKEDPARLRRFQALVQGALHGKYRHLHSLLVLNDGKLLLEEYFYGYGPRDPHPVQSVTKSIFSLLVGDAVEKGWLDPDDKLQDLFPGPPVSGDARKGKVTVKDLLTMTSGIDCDDLSRGKGCSWPMVASSDWGSFALSLPMTREPGKHFAYCGACLSILAEALQKQSKLPLLALAQKDLFDPLGIQAPTWWEGPQGAHSPAFGLSLTPRDMAKIGLLVLQKGEWQGQVVVPKEWIEKSTSPQVKDALGKGLDYGYLWWERNVIAHGRTRRVVEAWGVGGQYIFIVPDGGVVVVMTGGDAKDSRASRRCWDLFKRTFDILEGSHKKTRSPLKKGK